MDRDLIVTIAYGYRSRIVEEGLQLIQGLCCRHHAMHFAICKKLRKHVSFLHHPPLAFLHRSRSRCLLPKETVGRVRAVLMLVLSNDDKEDEVIEDDDKEDEKLVLM